VSPKVSQLNNFSASKNQHSTTYNDINREENMRILKKTNKKSYYALLKKEFHGSLIVSKRGRQISGVRLSKRISKGMSFII
jgi:hypothetical protein